MSRTAYIKRLAAASVAAVFITVAIGLLVMWMNGFIVEDKPSAVALTPCVFGEQASKPIDNPFARQAVAIDCIAPEEGKPLFVQWFDSILSRRTPEQGASGAAGG